MAATIRGGPPETSTTISTVTIAVEEAEKILHLLVICGFLLGNGGGTREVPSAGTRISSPTSPWN